MISGIVPKLKGLLNEWVYEHTETFLISYPRSGNHWVRFIVEWFSGRPTLGVKGNLRDAPIHKNQFSSTKNPLSHVAAFKMPILRKGHYCEYFDSQVKRRGQAVRLILILRDPFECITRHKGKVLKQDLNHYMLLVQKFHDYGGKKHLVYYEDLLATPQDEIERLLKFLGISLRRVGLFMRQYDSLVQLSRTARGREWSGSVSGEDPHFHKRQCDPKVLPGWREYIKSEFPERLHYVERYLSVVAL